VVAGSAVVAAAVVRHVRLDQAGGTGSPHLTGVAALADAIERLCIAKRESHLNVLTGADLGGVEDGVDESRSGTCRKVTGLQVKRCPSHQRVHKLDVGGSDKLSIVVVKRDLESRTVGHRCQASTGVDSALGERANGRPRAGVVGPDSGLAIGRLSMPEGVVRGGAPVGSG
jgi:hypothetical protein